jgi:hypothetical protein
MTPTVSLYRPQYFRVAKNSTFQPVRSAYQPPANSTFLSEQTSHRQPASSTLLSEQTSHQPTEQALHRANSGSSSLQIPPAWQFSRARILRARNFLPRLFLLRAQEGGRSSTQRQEGGGGGSKRVGDVGNKGRRRIRGCRSHGQPVLSSKPNKGEAACCPNAA